MIFHSYVSLPEGNNINMTNDNYTSFQYEEFQLKHKKGEHVEMFFAFCVPGNSGKLSVSQVRAKTGKVAMSAHSTFTDRGGGV